ncbi:MAG TPA: SDR family oxidoreductase [Anaerolineales bacterium]|nr:SDR family oxidoreductase [Anaerolineales bacterium]
MDLGLKDKCAFVASSSRGLGYATALELAREGCKVVINSRDETKIRQASAAIQRETGSLVKGIAGDISDPAVPDKLVIEAASIMGGIDLLVTNAGGPPSGSFESLDEAQWDKAVNLSLLSHVRLIRAALPYLRKSKAASVLTMTSWTVKQPMPNLVLSNSVRLATVGLTKSLALELGSDGIRFNSILPANIDTDRVRELQGFRAQKNGTTLEEERARDSASSVFGRMGRPDEFAKAAVFLLSPAASYITGLMLTIDGGQYKGTM